MKKFTLTNEVWLSALFKVINRLSAAFSNTWIIYNAVNLFINYEIKFQIYKVNQ